MTESEEATDMQMEETPFQKARRLVDRAHAEDPEGAELAYADGIEKWLRKLKDFPSELLLLAGRCQHLERWTLPRSDFPMDRVGYLKWRKTLYGRQADRARGIFLEAGIPVAEADEARAWIAKEGLGGNEGTQALEDAACLVFLEGEIKGFVETHPDYDEGKYLNILTRTWKKMSPRARELAAAIPQPDAIAALLRKASGAA